MNFSRAALRQAGRTRCAAPARRQCRRYASRASEGQPGKPGGSGMGRAAVYAGVFGAAAAGAYYYPQLKEIFTETEEPVQPPKAQPVFEKARRQPDSKEENRDMISSQHLQVKNSWEHPGVYAWGANSGKVIDPDSNEKYIKLPRRITFFNDQILRDLKLNQDVGAAITEKGDLVQWGLGYSRDDPRPTTTLKGRDLVKIQVSTDRIIALSSGGDVYSLPSSRDDLEGGAKQDQQKSSWSLWSSGGKERLSFRRLTPPGLAWGEKVTDISSGLEHCLLLTSKGRVFSAVSTAAAYPSRGQMGIPGLSWESRPTGAYDQALEITTLKGFDVKQVATGEYHSVVLDKVGRIFSFGDNTYGQLGLQTDGAAPFIVTPTLVSLNKLYAGLDTVPVAPVVTSVAAGGMNTFFTTDAELPGAQGQSRAVAPSARMPRTVSDLWACGQGVVGSLGTGKWTHVCDAPTKVKALSSLFEFDEKTNKNVPIKLKSLVVGATHAAAVMDNLTETNIGRSSSQNDTNWGADVMFWGGNEHYQLGTGKRSNVNAPAYIGPLDGGAGDADFGRMGEVHRLCLTPRQTVRIGEGGKGRKVTLEQKVECGKYITGVYSAA